LRNSLRERGESMVEKMLMDRPIRGSGLLTVREAAEYLGVSCPTIYDWKAQRILAYVKLGRKLMFRKSDLDEYIQRRWHPSENEYRLAFKIKAARPGPSATHAHPKGYRRPRKATRPGPSATHAYPKGHRRPRETSTGFRIVHSHPSARRRLLRIWKSGRKG
jgi:excisionase family DNA binding protein